MTFKDLELLLKDLCARLPYGAKMHINSPIEEQNRMELFDVNIEGQHIGVGNEKWAFRAIPIIDDEDEAKVVKPYLRPMSSMTEEEDMRRCAFLCDIEGGIEDAIPNYIDWLNEHHFDYRGLIEKGLALEAKEGTYK